MKVETPDCYTTLDSLNQSQCQVDSYNLQTQEDGPCCFISSEDLSDERKRSNRLIARGCNMLIQFVHISSE